MAGDDSDFILHASFLPSNDWAVSPSSLDVPIVVATFNTPSVATSDIAAAAASGAPAAVALSDRGVTAMGSLSETPM